MPTAIDTNPWNYPDLVPLINHREPICDHDFLLMYRGVTMTRLMIPNPLQVYCPAVEGCYICGHATNGIYVYLMKANTNRYSQRIPR